MRNASFALTTKQVRHRTKTVTRRLGWAWVKPGTLLQPVIKSQGIPKGDHIEKIGGPIRVVSVRRERLDAIEQADVVIEGFPEMTPRQFVDMFCRHNGCAVDEIVTRIEFEYVEDGN